MVPSPVFGPSVPGWYSIRCLIRPPVRTFLLQSDCTGEMSPNGFFTFWKICRNSGYETNWRSNSSKRSPTRLPVRPLGVQCPEACSLVLICPVVANMNRAFAHRYRKHIYGGSWSPLDNPQRHDLCILKMPEKLSKFEVRSFLRELNLKSYEQSEEQLAPLTCRAPDKENQLRRNDLPPFLSILPISGNKRQVSNQCAAWPATTRSTLSFLRNVKLSADDFRKNTLE